MGLLSLIGGALGSVIPGVGTVIGAAVGGLADAAFSGSGGSSGASSGGVQKMPVESSATTLNSIRSATKSNNPVLQGSIQTAKAVGENSTNLSQKKTDPWQNTRDWYTTLGGDKDAANNINAENMPF